MGNSGSRFCLRQPMRSVGKLAINYVYQLTRLNPLTFTDSANPVAHVGINGTCRCRPVADPRSVP